MLGFAPTVCELTDVDLFESETFVNLCCGMVPQLIKYTVNNKTVNYCYVCCLCTNLGYVGFTLQEAKDKWNTKSFVLSV